MKINPKFSNPQDITIESYLNAYGIDDVEEFINPKGKYLDDINYYTGIENGIKWLENIRDNYNKAVGIVVDSDMDGYCSAALAYTFLKHLGVEIIVPYFHNGKKHGLGDILEKIQSDYPYYIWCPDAGTNDISACKILRSMGIRILITDHHKSESPNIQAVIINNQISPNITNKALSGTGVTYQLIRAYCEKYGDDWHYDKLDLVAFANIADVCSMANYENRWINSWGLKYITNPLLKAMCKEFIRSDKVTPKDVGWSISPKLNSLCRGNDQELKEKTFKALCGKIEDIDEVVKELRRCHDRQTREVKAIYADLLNHEPFISNNIVIERLAESTPYTGLIATKLSDHYSRPVILVHEKNNFFTGSCRSPVDFRQYLVDSNSVVFASGHEKAFGIGFGKNQVNDLISYFGNHPLPIEPTKDVTCEVQDVLHIPNAIYELNSHSELWGKDIPAPNICMRNIQIKGTDIKPMAGNSIKFRLGMVDFVKFACSNEFKENLGVGQNVWLNLDVIGEPQYNEWNGNISKQVMISEIERK